MCILCDERQRSIVHRYESAREKDAWNLFFGMNSWSFSPHAATFNSRAILLVSSMMQTLVQAPKFKALASWPTSQTHQENGHRPTPRYGYKIVRLRSTNSGQRQSCLESTRSLQLQNSIRPACSSTILVRHPGLSCFRPSTRSRLSRTPRKAEPNLGGNYGLAAASPDKKGRYRTF